MIAPQILAKLVAALEKEAREQLAQASEVERDDELANNICEDFADVAKDAIAAALQEIWELPRDKRVF